MMLSKYLYSICVITLTYGVYSEAVAQSVTAELGGRYMVDYTSADLRSENVEVRNGGIRQIRVSVSGDLGESLEYEGEIDIDGDDLSITDLNIEYSPKGSAWSVKAGQQRVNASLDEQTSSRFTTTLERAAFTNAFDFSRRLGVSARHSGKRHMLALGGFSSNLDGPGGGGFDRGAAVSARATYTAVKTDDVIVHIGGSWRYRKAGKDNRDIRYEQDAYARNFPDEILRSDRFARSDNFVGLEAAVSTGSAWVSAEIAGLKAKADTAIDTNRGGNTDSANFHGGYIEAGYFLGGERDYAPDGFGRPDISNPFGQGGLGGVSVVARYDVLDLQDVVEAGELKTVVLGADWWPSSHTRLGINYFRIEAEDARSREGDGMLMRAQFDF